MNERRCGSRVREQLTNAGHRGSIGAPGSVIALIAAAVLASGSASAQLVPWGDPLGDVSVANADIVSGSGAVDGDTVHLRVTFGETPFPNTRTHFIDWCLDLDQSAETGDVCSGSYPGADGAVSFTSVPGAPTPVMLEVLRQGSPTMVLDPATHAVIDDTTHTACVFFPRSLLSDDGIFDYIVLSIFGSSGGANDLAPDNPAFGTPGGKFTSEAGTLPPCGGGESVECKTQGFWKNHLDSWPVSSLRLGNEDYGQTELVGLLRTPPRGDASLILAHQLIAAKLNVAAGAPGTAIAPSVTASDAWLGGFSGRLPYVVRASSPSGREATILAEELAAYNEGGASCTSDAIGRGGDGTTILSSGDPSSNAQMGGILVGVVLTGLVGVGLRWKAMRR